MELGQVSKAETNSCLVPEVLFHKIPIRTVSTLSSTNFMWLYPQKYPVKYFLKKSESAYLRNTFQDQEDEISCCYTELEAGKKN